MRGANGLDQTNACTIIKTMFNKRKSWLKQELKRINRIIESFPFKYEVKLEGIKQVREGIRMDYDKQKEQIDAYKIRGEDEKKKEFKLQNQDIIKQMADLVKKFSEESKNMEEQMDELDKEYKETEMTCNSRIEAARAYKGLVLRLLKK